MASPFSFPPVEELAAIALRCAAVYLTLLLVLRLAGKRYQGQLSPHDFVVMLLVANAVQTAMVGSSVSVVGGLVGVVTLIGINLVVSRFILRHQRWGPLLAGVPTLLIRNGIVLHDHLKRERILATELEAQLRAHGFESAEQVKIAIQESDGSISVIGYAAPHEQQLPALPSTRR